MTDAPNPNDLSPEAARRLLEGWPPAAPTAAPPTSVAHLSDAEYLAMKNALLRTLISD